MRSPAWTWPGLLLLGLGMEGCLLGPDQPPDLPPSPERFSELGKPSAEPLRAPEPISPDFEFWRELGDPVLTGLVERALSGSPDVARATAKIRESRALAGAAWSALFPEVRAGAGVDRVRFSTETPLISQFPLTNAPGFTADANDWKASLSASYELDFWGRNRRARESALHELEGDVERRRSVGLSLAGDVSLAYIDYRTLERRRRVAEQVLAELTALRVISRDREAGGLGSALDVARAEAEVARAQATLADLGRLLSLCEHRLSVLVGSPPGSLRKTLETEPGTLRIFSAPPGIPAQLLTRRPDLRELSHRLRAATARVGEAEAEMLPRVVLTGEIGTEAVDVSKLASHGAFYWSAGPSVQIPLFDFGRRKNNWTAVEERADQALHDLEKQILVALQDVEDALTCVRDDGRRREALALAAQAGGRASRIATDKYRTGLISQLDVIDAERLRLDSEDALADAEGRVLRDAVGLAKALGGGFGAAERHMPPLAPEGKE